MLMSSDIIIKVSKDAVDDKVMEGAGVTAKVRR
jgi:hypothetical protein